MIFKPSNPLSVVVFIFSLLRDGIFWISDWIITRYHMVLFRLKQDKAREKSWLSYFF